LKKKTNNSKNFHSCFTITRDLDKQLIRIANELASRHSISLHTIQQCILPKLRPILFEYLSSTLEQQAKSWGWKK